MHTAIIIPCLNEEAVLAATCKSLGFGSTASEIPEAILVLVDNGSNDSTLGVMKEIQRTSSQTVIIANESERGYVPPRNRGVAVARTFFQDRGIVPSDVLILQADADTIYAPNYVSLFAAAACDTSGALFEGVARSASAFVGHHPRYFRAVVQADTLTLPFSVAEADEVLIDDKVAGYRLGDYDRWGGHRREYDDSGNEIHAETSRLFLRAKMTGAHRVRVPDAIAYPSRRKLELDPLLYFVTAGFPREAHWVEQWHAAAPAIQSLDQLEQESALELFEHFAIVRQTHHLVLFGLIPAYVLFLLRLPDEQRVLESPLGELAPKINLTAGDIASNPGRLFSRAFSFLDTERRIFERCLGSLRS